MSQPNASSKRILHLLEQSYLEIDRKLEEFHSALQNLRCEGKVAYGRNVKRLKLIAKFLKSKLSRHIKREEKLLFPFLRKSIPKLELVIGLLAAEHDGFMRNLGEIESLCGEIGRDESAMSNNRLIQQIYETGQSLIFLLRHHSHLERNSIYKVIDTELKLSEKKQLTTQLSKQIV